MLWSIMQLKEPLQDMWKWYFGIGIYNPKTEENVWTLIRSAKMFWADFVFMIGKRYKKQCSDVKLSTKIPVFYFEDLDQFYTCMPPVEKYVAIELVDDSIKLKDYKHPRQWIYLLWSEDCWLPKEVIESNRFDFVEIEWQHSLNVSVAWSIVLYDRYVKL